VQSALESAIAELALGAPFDLADASAVAAWIQRHGIAPEDADALLSDGLERWLVYRTLVRDNLREPLLLAMPRSAARLGALFEEYFSKFLAERGPRTHYLRDVAREFLDFCAPLWQHDRRVPPFLHDLARHEASCIEIGSLETRRAGPAVAELDLDRTVCFIEAARLAEYAHAVHELSENEDDRSEPARHRTQLFVYRSPEHEVRYLELTPLAAEILRRLLAGETLRAALEGACGSLGVALDSQVLQGAARVLSDLAERGALLGAPAVEQRKGAS
jgi:hypothetical protein